MSEVFNFDFDKLQKQGISKEASLNFLRTKTENNFNFDELENTFRSNGFNEQEITNAMYYSLQEANKSGDLWLRPLPQNDLVSGNHSSDLVNLGVSGTTANADLVSSSAPKSTENHESNATILNHTQNPQEIHEAENENLETHKGEVFASDFKSFQGGGEGSLLNINDRADTAESLKSTAKTSPTEKGYFEGILEGFGFDTDNVKAINAKADKALKESVIEGRELKDLSELEKRRLFELYNDNKGFFELNSMEASLEKEYNRLKEKQNIAKIKDVKDLSQEQKEIIANDLGAFQNAWDYFFTDKQEVLKQWQENYKAQSEILPQTQKAIAFLDNIHKHKSISNIIESAYKGEMNKEAFDDYLGEVETIATTAGFDEIGYNKKGELYFYKGENAYKVNQGFFDNFTNILGANAGSISGGVSGAIAGAKLAKTPQTAIAGAIAGGAVGAFVGGGADVLITNAYLNRENNFDEIVRHATEEGALSLVGDIALLGVAKYGGKALAKAQELPLGKIIDYTPLLGFAKRAIDGNASSAQKLIDKTYTQEQLQALKEMGESFGANLSFEAKLGTNPFKATFGDEHSFTKSYDILQNALTLPTQRARQQEFIQAIRADESGQLLAFLSEASAQSPKAYDNMRSILNATSFQVKKQLDNLNLNKGDIKAVFDELESGTKQSYDEAINKVIGGIYNDSYKVNLNELKRETKELSLLDKTKPLRQVKSDELSDELLTQVIEQDVKLWIDNLSPKIAKALNIPNAKITMRGSAMQHALNRHGKQSNLAKNGQPPIIPNDLRQHGNYVNGADMHGVKTLPSGERLLISGKQVNGYYVIVESISTKHNELKLKTLYKENGNLQNAEAFKKDVKIIHTAPTSQTPSSKGYDLARNQAEVKSDTADSTTKQVFNQGDIKFDSLGEFEYFARLSGFTNLPQEKLQSAHKYILENLHKLEC